MSEHSAHSLSTALTRKKETGYLPLSARIYKQTSRKRIDCARGARALSAAGREAYAALFCPTCKGRRITAVSRALMLRRTVCRAKSQNRYQSTRLRPCPSCSASFTGSSTMRPAISGVRDWVWPWPWSRRLWKPTMGRSGWRASWARAVPSFLPCQLLCRDTMRRCGTTCPAPWPCHPCVNIRLSSSHPIRIH